VGALRRLRAGGAARPDGRPVRPEVVRRHGRRQRRYSRENRRAFSTAHDYLHVFAPAGHEWKHHRNRLPRNDRPGTWRNGDGDPRGHWSTVSLVAQGGHGTKDQFYAIALPSGRVVEPPPGSCWRVTRERFAALERDGLI
jgi:adenine-specific DNA-methyltransferase